MLNQEPKDRNAVARVILDAQDESLTRRSEVFLNDFETFISTGKYKWDAILTGVADMIDREKIGQELWAEGAYAIRPLVAQVIRNMAQALIILRR